VKPEVSIMRALQKPIQVAILTLALCAVTVATASADAEKARLRNELGITYAKDGHLDDALRYFSLILAEYPENPAALNNSANVYFVQGETERAKKLYERAIHNEPEEGGIHLNLGILLYSIGEEQASAARVRRGLELIGDPHEAYYLLGLSTQPPGSDSRAADASDLQASEIEELLARAMAEIPAAAKAQQATQEGAEKSVQTAQATQAPAEKSAAESQKVSTRPGGAKASKVDPDVVANRLFWMSVPKNP
jgi:Tfp pilus assembly protein PilF